MSLLIDGKEGSDIATTDIVGAYILTTMEEGVLLKLIGHIVNMMCQINHKYLPYVTQEGDKKSVIRVTQESTLWLHTISHIMVCCF